MTGRILITPRSLSTGGHPALAPLEAAGYELVFPAPGATPSEAQLVEAVPGCLGWLAGVEPISEAVIEAADALKVISRNGTGIDNLPLAAIDRRRIAVKRAVGTNAQGVAELALGLTFAGLRNIVPAHMGICAGAWPRKIGREIRDAEVAVIGLGAIGRVFARFAVLLGARVRGADPFVDTDEFEGPGFRAAAVEEALRGADIVSLHAPLAKGGEPMIDAAALSRLAPGAVVVNTSRAGLVDDEAMLAALASGQVRAYATDVFETEPPSLSPLLTHPNTILTCHIGGFTRESVARTTKRAVDNILEVLDRDAH